MTLYEFNKAGYVSLPKLTKKGWEDARDTIVQYLTTFPSDFYMLLNNEVHYYTMFTWKDDSSHSPFLMTDEMIDIIKNLGKVKAIERNGRLIEVWVERDGECTMYVLFDYADGVIEV